MTPTEALARYKAATKSARERAEEAEHAIVRKSVLAGTGAALGYAAKKGMPDAVVGVPTKLAIGVTMTLVEMFSKGSVQRLAGAVGDAAIAVYSHEAVQEGSFVAGAL